jgi:hypothetical protein
VKKRWTGSQWKKNVKGFRVYRKFSTDAVIKFDGEELSPLPDKTREQTPPQPAPPQPPKVTFCRLFRGRIEDIPDTPYRFDQLRILRIRLDLFPQASHINIDYSLPILPGLTPDRLQ